MSGEGSKQNLEELKRTTIEMIQWKRGVDEETRTKMVEEKKEGLPVWSIVLGIMAEERNQIDDSLPKFVPDDFAEELIGYAEFISEMRDVFESFDPRLREKKVKLLLKIDRLIQKSSLGLQRKGLKSTDFSTQNLARLSDNSKVLKKDRSGFTLADQLVSKAEFTPYGRHRGILQAATRYKELYEEVGIV